ncbi:4Fe-4S binding protein [Pontibacter chinhatensis]|uniref:4Fe-4S binding domain-containing protein n=1 Tax=Pontibacter chinhatensis TaxID=1436961 RepID=A0A1I2NKA6_9BACT|nr:4Fe-4S dicluster domain-containing protein [Pontibacter chinhatensis]SFG04425.1 4Fe-4S binding domain-containing protein [Pontibacter chinhatensis]
MKAIQKIGLGGFLLALLLFNALLFMGQFRLTEAQLQEAVKQEHVEVLRQELQPMLGKTYTSSFSFATDFNRLLDNYNEEQQRSQQWDRVIWDDYAFALARVASQGFVENNKLLLLFLTVIMGAAGALLYILPQHRGEPAGIRNNGVMFSSNKSRGMVGITIGVYLTAIYVLLYWYPEYIVNWALLVDPLSYTLAGGPASQWFLYGTIYTLAILVMGVRMFRKYKGNNYQLLRTASVMFFQLSFAFLIPEILVVLNLPWYDLKNIWPLDYDFFFEYSVASMLGSGSAGLFLFIWGILLIIVAVPLFTYFYGKRWYCSWVCGCGGLAETAGDPYRHLSDKSLKAWKVERWMVYPILVIITVITLLTIANYFTEFALLKQSTDMLHQWYGFLIGAAFAGVVGVGFYPLMGNRVWCRFGCPLAAYIGIVQRFKSRFRITTNGGQCISCGNCSTYCEMGIDVRWYAQRGQNIVRASCVGCGICASVCPRGVLKLENGPEQGRITDIPFLTGNESIKVLN